MGQYSIEVVRTEEGLRALEQSWRSLEPRMLKVPFVTFDWVQAWWQHLRSNSPYFRDELNLLVFRRPGGEVAGFAPLMQTTPRIGFLEARHLQFIGADPNITELRCLAVPVEETTEVYAALLDHLHANRRGSNWVRLSGLPSGTGLLDIAADRFGGSLWKREVPNFYLELKPTWEEFKAALSRNIKESLRKCYNSPKRDGIEFEFTVVSDPAQVDAAVDDFLRLHGERAQQTDGVIHPNVFVATSAQAFLRDFCLRFARQDRLRVFQIRRQGVVVATRIGFLSGDCLYLYYSGYDQAYAKYSVMTTLVAEAIQYAIGQKLQTVNLSIGRDVSKERWGPREILYDEIEAASRTPFGRYKYDLFKFAVRQMQGNRVVRWMGRQRA